MEDFTGVKKTDLRQKMAIIARVSIDRVMLEVLPASVKLLFTILLNETSASSARILDAVTTP